MAAGNSPDWYILKEALILGAAATLTTVGCFWAVFLTVVTASYVVQHVYIPPRYQSFPVSFDYDPYYLVDGVSPVPVYGVRNLPVGLRGGGGGLEGIPDLTFNEENPFFRAHKAPDAALGFADIALNVSGLQVQADPQPRYIARLLRIPLGVLGLSQMPRSRMSSLRDFPLEIALIFDYNSRGFCGSHDGAVDRPPHAICAAKQWGWLDTPSVQPIDIRSAFFSERGMKVLEVSTAFFPATQWSRLQDAVTNVAASAVGFALYFLPLHVEQLTASAGWQAGSISLYENVVLSDLTARMPLERARWLKIRISPKLPIRNAAVVFQAKAIGVAAWLQAYPTAFSIGTAFIAATCVAVGVAASSTIVIAICLIYATYRKKLD